MKNPRIIRALVTDGREPAYDEARWTGPKATPHQGYVVGKNPRDKKPKRRKLLQRANASHARGR